MLEEQTKAEVRDYYGKVLQSNADLKTSACCPVDAMSPRLRRMLNDVHPAVIEKFYGCGSPIPFGLEGATVLDLGSGSGRDCFLLSKLVGPTGRVIGVDMTDEQLAVAEEYKDWHRERFGFAQSNITFHKGYIEDLAELGIADDSIDLVVSNCVINLSPAKQRVFSEIFRVLRPGGELYYSDVFSGRRVPPELAADKVMVGECLGGALYIEDFRRMLADLGCADYRVVSSAPITLEDGPLQEMAGMIDFHSTTIRAFKLDLEDRCENYGQVAYYLGTLAECPHRFLLDDHHVFEKGLPLPVCGNTADMLSGSRYGRHFRVVGDKSVHFGIFDCGPTAPAVKSDGFGACC